MNVSSAIIIVEDDKDLLEYLRQLFVDQRYTVHPVETGTKALQLVETVNPDLVILDLTLPDITGESVCIELKKMYPEIPVIILTGKDTPQDVVTGLNLGADDYVTKPFSADELLARVKARLRHGNTQLTLTASDLTVNTQTFEVKRGTTLIPLTQTEYSLLTYLLQNKNRVLTRDMILSSVWSYTPDVESRVVDVYVGYLRKKIDKGFEKPLIHSLRGFGYVLKDE